MSRLLLSLFFPAAYTVIWYWQGESAAHAFTAATVVILWDRYARRRNDE